MNGPRYAELQVTSHFSFLRGASGCDELFATAALLGIEALAIVDRNSLAGIVRAHEAAKTTGVRLVVGCRLDLADGMSVLVYPTDRPAYSRLCRLLSLGKKRGGKAKCHLEWADLVAYREGLLAVLLPDHADDGCGLRLRRLREAFGDRAYMALSLRRRPNDQLRLHELSNLATRMRVPTIVTNDVLFHAPDRRILQDVVTCIRHNVTIDALGERRERHADRYLKPPEEMHRLFGRYPEALARTLQIAERCRFSLDELAYQYPEERDDPALTPQETLAKLTWEGAAERYPEGLPDSVRAALEHELRLIEKLQYAPYFLTVNSIVRFARSKDILCQGRGSAANSAVCYVLGITSIDPGRNDLLFERFVSEERREPPDIDVDFEHERREIVMQWVFETYGRDHAALCSTVIRYRSKGALRDVGKALGLTEDLIKTLSSQVWGWSEEGVEPKHVEELNLNLGDRRLRLALDLARQLMGAPRHLSQHPGGFVLTHDRLDELVPIEPAAMVDRQVIEWDKDDIDALKFMKVDVLALGMLTCMKRGLDLLADHKGVQLDLATIPAEDPRTYAMIRKADTLGTFQIESRAQMSMLPRLRPRTFYDLVVQVAIVRPGPIQGDMVHPYLRRREGLEPVHYPKPELEKVLGKTLGVPLFQEQAMRVAIECAGFTPGEADMLRKSMATFKFTGGVSHFRDKLINGMVDNGYEPEFAEHTFKQLEGFGSYGFPESHAASFALIAYASAWLKCWHPDIFCAALLNSQPMGFYAPAQIVRDAQDHHVEVRPVCINASRWDCTLEPTGDDGRFAVRLGLRMVKGLANANAAAIVSARADTPFASIDDLWRRAGVPVAALVQIAEGDGFRPSLSMARREALWAIKALRDEPLPLFAAATAHEQQLVPEISEAAVSLRPMTAGSEVVEDYGHIGLSLRSHPVAFLRDDLRRRRIFTCQQAMDARDGRWLEAAGIVLVRQRPGSAKGVMFITLEDETGIANLVVWPQVFEKNRRIILSAGMFAVRGRIQREGEVVHLVAQRLTDLSADLASVGDRDAAFPLPHGRGDEFHHGSPTPDPRGLAPKGLRTRDIYIPDLHIDSIKVKTRDFR
ncbi:MULTISPECIES: error-prone DNA polymerase [Alphaproteobacteria]|jgi:error-prone DNA polymerase|uniref:error-prone DNA polymerase n=1 Tax=Alphaproteobacteria TaxID=28211 RepID=UPI00082554C5|nr:MULTISPECIES: error-prone DNA polymerase [Alphaproteobacteria]MBX9875121.1 error-prone DNA polymerase [Beijerinckiaceae bacterium]PZU73135.1 MAG: error-prone DNA polymerase [Rhizobium sp.]MBF5088464.1 DNA polymerase III subunit alpha [Novosphingobium sp. NBM11]NTE96348.1 DNA polymerase III subunit alpha [Agrobacterium tumefaciens]TQN60929.1 DNA polymerase III subunit alpha [Agrobacterium tumefaciens]